MSYHTSGSMSRSYGGGYGTVKISLQDFGTFKSGDRVRYSTIVGQVPNDHGFVDVYKNIIRIPQHDASFIIVEGFH